MTTALIPHDLLDWHDRGDFIQLGHGFSGGGPRLTVGADDSWAAVELSHGAASALADALTDWTDGLSSTDADALAGELEDLRGELEEVTEERDGLRETVKELREQLAKVGAAS